MNIKKFIKTNLVGIIKVLVALVLLAILCFLTYYTTNVFIQRENANNELQIKRYELENLKVNLENEIQNKNLLVEEKNKKVQELENSITGLNNELSNYRNNTVKPPTANSPPRSTPRQTTKSIPKSSSIYDRISADSQIKSNVVNALNLIKAADYNQFSIINQQVGIIYGSSECGGWQNVTRDIHVGNCNGQNSDGILAAIIVHEATHVYNVYVRKIYSYQTSAQELPCYQAELLIAQKLNLPAYFINWVQSQIDYWSTQ